MTNPINKIPLDKLRHIVAGVLFCLFYLPCILFKIDILFGFIFCAGVAAGKEIYDNVTKKGTPEIIDALTTMIAPALFYILIKTWVLFQ